MGHNEAGVQFFGDSMFLSAVYPNRPQEEKCKDLSGYLDPAPDPATILPSSEVGSGAAAGVLQMSLNDVLETSFATSTLAYLCMGLICLLSAFLVSRVIISLHQTLSRARGKGSR